MIIELSQGILGYILEINHIIVAIVLKLFMIVIPRKDIGEHILEGNHINGSNVAIHCHQLKLLKNICSCTVEKSHTNAINEVRLL